MDVATFWKMIEDARKTANGDVAKQTELLVEALSKESDKEIIEYGHIFRDIRDIAYRGNLYDACVFIHCWCTDTDFMDFRAWLIAQGKEIFENAIKNPDSLADIVDSEHRQDVMHETFAYVASYAYQRRNGEEAELPFIPRERPPSFIGDIHAVDQLPDIFPALMAKLGSCDE